MLDILALLLSLAAIFSYINERHLHLQMTIGLMLLSLIFVVIITSLNHFGLDYGHSHLQHLMTEIDFSQVVLQGVLCFLLFAGSKNISLQNLKQYRWDVITFSIAATLIATFVTGTLIFGLFVAFKCPLAYIHALIFGAIISPTDPVAALSILKNLGLPSNIELVIDGESQFNDGIGVVVFVTLTGIAFGGETPTAAHISLLFLREVGGGIVLGLVAAALTHYLISRSHSVTTPLLLTLAAVSACYATALSIDVSGPIASVVLGLCVGNLSLKQLKHISTTHSINAFWDMVNQVINAVLFVLIGLVAISIGVPSWIALALSISAIACVLVGRYISVALSMTVLRLKHRLKFNLRPGLINLFTWAGLRGALAVALTLSLPDGHLKQMLLPMTYIVVTFSILIQATSLGRLFPANKLQRLGQ